MQSGQNVMLRSFTYHSAAVKFTEAVFGKII